MLAGALIGATLAAAGVVLQALLRNPLATPFTLGVSAGAALGAMLAIAMRLDLGVLGVSSVPIASFIGSLAAIAHRLRAGLVAAARAVDQRPAAGRRHAELVLLGADPLRAVPRRLRRSRSAPIRWLMGDLDVGSYGPIVAALPFIVAAFAVFAMLPRALNLLTMGEDVAASRGVDVVRAQRLGVPQRVAGHRRGGVAGRADRLHRHRRARTWCG